MRIHPGRLHHSRGSRWACVPSQVQTTTLHPNRNAVSSGVTRLNPGGTCVMEPLMKELCPIEPYNECSDIENPMGGLLNS